jgi:beta-1,4-mannosyltransferase
VLSHREHRSAGILYKVDVFHFHWINAYLNHKPFKAFIATFTFILYILILKFRGTKIIWTLHNSVEFTHHGKNKWLENILVPFLLNRVDKIIVHSKFQKNHLDKKYQDKIVWIPHQNYCSILNNKLKNSNSYYLFFGGIDKYKGLEIAIEAYKKSIQLLPFKIIGKVSDSEYKNKLIKLIDNNKNIFFEDRYVEDDELEILVKNAKSIILPFKQVTNSGSLIYALSCNTNVIISNSILTDELLSEYKNLDNYMQTFTTELELIEIFNQEVSFVNKFKKNDFINKTNIEKLVYKYKEIFNEKNTNFTK